MWSELASLSGEVLPSHIHFLYLMWVKHSLYRWRDECGFGSFSVGVQTPTEIEELRLKSSHPVKTPE